MTRVGNALQKGLDILETLQEADGPLPFGELRKRVNVSQASFARYLKVLSDRGYVARDDGGYKIGYRTIRLGLHGLSRLELPGIARAHLDRTTEQVRESTELAVFEGGDFIFLDRVECPRSVVLRARPGSSFGISDNNAIGTLALAFGWKGKATRLTKKKLEAIHAQGFAEQLQNNDEVYRGGAPLLDHAGSCIGALCIAAPAFRVTKKEKALFRKVLIEHAHAVSGKLGYAEERNVS
jgi:IclR family acetate operon transcriptional repressor